MKVNFVKQPGGVLAPASDIEAERMSRIKTGTVHEIDIKNSEKRNRGFHGKVFAFVNFCFQYWCADNTDIEFQCEAAQFDYFRKQLTIKAGYYDYVAGIDGSVRVQARSLSYDSMSQDEFEQFNVAIQNAAMATIFQHADEQTLIKLHSFF